MSTLTVPEVIGVLEILKHELLDGCLYGDVEGEDDDDD